MFKNKQPIIKFTAVDDFIYNVYEAPYSAKKNMPDWYKRQPKLTTPGKFSIGENGNPNHTIKACMPVFDAITAGYMIPVQADIYFETNELGDKSSHWSTNNLRAIESHPISQYSEFSVPDGYHKAAFKFIQPWVIQTPPGYSCLFIQPILRDDLPFYIIPAVVDTDQHPLAVNFPFFIKEDFNGTIPMGTPMVQVIPFKREDWTSEIVEDLSLNLKRKWIAAERKITNRYKTFFRSVKRWD